MTPIKVKKINVAHSPDADDIFMYYAIKLGWVSDAKYQFSNQALDIQTLNEGALDNLYDICAISFGCYPKIAQDYTLLRCAVSFGDGYGPKLIKTKDKVLKQNFKVALSGQDTTNALIFKCKYPHARITYMNFLDIEQAVLDGKVDAGVLIHESILEFDDRLCVEVNLFDLWLDLAKKHLPLPLGGMALKRSIYITDAINYENLLTKAILVANKYKSLLSQMLLERNLVRVDSEKLETYLNMYANDQSHSLNDLQIEAINKLYEIGYKYEQLPIMKDIRHYLIPQDYATLRYS